VDRAQKKELVATLNSVFKETGVVVVTHNLGLTVPQMNDLRVQKMAEAGGATKVAKNRLAKLALEGTDVAGIADLFSGPTMVSYSEDPVAAPKVIAAFRQGSRQACRARRGAWLDGAGCRWRQGTCKHAVAR
jgi:large subunit ribosomal protein L10